MTKIPLSQTQQQATERLNKKKKRASRSSSLSWTTTTTSTTWSKSLLVLLMIWTWSLPSSVLIGCPGRMMIVVHAMTAIPIPYDEIQPDGTIVKLRIEGDEIEHYERDMNGYTILLDPITGYRVYAEQVIDGSLVPSTYRVTPHSSSNSDSHHHDERPNGLVKRLRDISIPTTTRIEQLRRQSSSSWFYEDEEEDEEQNIDTPTNIMNNQQRRLGETEVITSSINETNTTSLLNYQKGRRRRKLSSPTKGIVNNLVIPIQFLDHINRTLPNQTELDILFNYKEKTGHSIYCPTGSIYNVFYENSYGQLQLQSTILDWILIPYTEEWTAYNKSGLTTRIYTVLKSTLDYLEQEQIVNFEDFDRDNDGHIDAITFLHSGYAAEWGGKDEYGTTTDDRIWSHKSDKLSWISKSSPSSPGRKRVKITKYHISPSLWGRSGSEIGRIGVIAHETGHFLGLGDLYDGDTRATIGGELGNGIGNWGLMSSSWGLNGDQRYPPHFCAWSKIQLGWIIPTEVQYGINYISATEVQPPPNSDADGDDVDDVPSLQKLWPRVIQIGNGKYGYPKGEYLLIENRQPIGLDRLIPQGGLVIYHIDEKTQTPNRQGYPGQENWPQNGNHYRIAVLQADGNYDLEHYENIGDKGDVFHGGKGGVNYLGPSQGNSTTMGPFPNTDSYQNGNVYKTTNEIFNIGRSRVDMWFSFTNIEESASPSMGPSTSPSFSPSKMPSIQPSFRPTISPSSSPTHTPTTNPSVKPSSIPTETPTYRPSHLPSVPPSTQPSISSAPTPLASMGPTDIPSTGPSSQPSGSPSTSRPSVFPTVVPTFTPSPTTPPTSSFPSHHPTTSPSQLPTPIHSEAPTQIRRPSPALSDWPTVIITIPPPSVKPSSSPTVLPTTFLPTASPTTSPSSLPSTSKPTVLAANSDPTNPTLGNTPKPTSPMVPSDIPTPNSSVMPSSCKPSLLPSRNPSPTPITSSPTHGPTHDDSEAPSSHPITTPPSSKPSFSPLQHPSLRPSLIQPSSSPVLLPSSDQPATTSLTQTPSSSMSTDMPTMASLSPAWPSTSLSSDDIPVESLCSPNYVASLAPSVIPSASSTSLEPSQVSSPSITPTQDPSTVPAAMNDPTQYPTTSTTTPETIIPTVPAVVDDPTPEPSESNLQIHLIENPSSVVSGAVNPSASTATVVSSTPIPTSPSSPTTTKSMEPSLTPTELLVGDNIFARPATVAPSSINQPVITLASRQSKIPSQEPSSPPPSLPQVPSSSMSSISKNPILLSIAPTTTRSVHPSTATFDLAKSEPASSSSPSSEGDENDMESLLASSSLRLLLPVGHPLSFWSVGMISAMTLVLFHILA